MTSPSMPKIFRSIKRYSDVDRPDVGDTCFFSHAMKLIPGEFVKRSKAFLHEWIKQDALVTVIRNAASFTEVRFVDAPQTDYVCSDFLMKVELTAFGQAFFDQHANKMSPRIRKFFTGEKHNEHDNSKKC